MGKGRTEAFSDGVLAVIITIMVLELHVPEGVDFADLWSVYPRFLSYVLSFVYIGIYWNNHHHLMHGVQHVNGSVLWANNSCCSGCRWCRSPPTGWARRISPAIR